MGPLIDSESASGAILTRGSAHSSRVEALLRLDAVTWVLAAHALVLLSLGRAINPGLGAAAAGGIVVWRLTLVTLVRRATGHRKVLFELVLGAGSLLLAGVMLLVDGGTESPFFFWWLILLGWQALIHPLTRFALLAAVASVVYLGVILVVPDLTPASLGRFGLLLAFVAILALGRFRLEDKEAVAERAARLLRDAFWAAPVGLALVDGEPLRLLYANQSAHGMRLFSGSEGVNRVLEDLVREVRESGESVGPELVTTGSGARSRHYRVMATPHRNNGGMAVVVCADDVTERVHSGEERRRFLQLASHQLRTPLTPIIGYAELLKDGRLDPEDEEEAVEAILKAGRRLDRLFERMAAVVRLQHEPDRDCVEAEMGRVMAELRSLDPEVMAGVDVSGDPSDRIRCHPPSVAQALRELLDNGQRFGSPPVRLFWERSEDVVAISVTDAGEGPVGSADEADPFGEWGQGGELDLMSPGMGTRLGLFQARLLTDLGGGHLSLAREADWWALVMRFAPAGPARTVPAESVSAHTG